MIQAGGAWLEAYGRWIVRRRLIATLLLVIITVAAALGTIERLKHGTPVDFTPQAIFMGEGELWDRLQATEREFGADDNVMVVLLKGPLSTPEGLSLLRQIHNVMASHPKVEDVQSLVTGTIATADGPGMLRVEDAIQSGDDPLGLASRDRFSSGLLISTDQTVTTVRARIDTDIHEISVLGPVVRDLESQVRSLPLGSDFEVHITGVPFVRTEVVDLMLNDQIRFLPIVMVIFGVTVVFMFRRVWLGLTPLVGVLFGIIWAMGALLSSGTVLNILSVLAPTLVLVIGAADGIHLTARYREELRQDGDRVAAMGRTLRHMSLACFLTTFTTATGFASLIVADTKVIRDFGIHCAGAVSVTYLAVVLAVPTLLAWLPVERIGTPSERRDNPIYTAVDTMVARRPGRVLVVTLGLTLFAVWLGRHVQTNSRLLEMYHTEHPTHIAIELAQEQVGGVIPVFVHFKGAEGQMLEPEVLTAMKDIETRARAEPLTGWTASPASWIGHLHELLTGEPGLPDSRALAAQELLLAEMSGELAIDRVLSDDRARARIMMMSRDEGGREFIRVKRDLESYAAQILQGTGVQVEVTGDGILASAGVDQLITDLLKSTGLVFAVILGTMFVLLRDMRLALIAAIPNLVPLVFIVATLGLMDAELQTSNIVSFTVAIGLAVDDTIHFIVRYQEERKHGLARGPAISRTYQGAGHAIVITSVLLVLGFGVMGFSDLTSTKFFGILAAVTMVAAVLGDLFLLPAMLHLFGRHTEEAA